MFWRPPVLQVPKCCSLRMLLAVCKFLFINSNWTVWHKMNTVHQIELFCFWISIEKLTYIINATKRKHCKKVHCMLMVPLTKERGQHPGACGIRCLWIDRVSTLASFIFSAGLDPAKTLWEDSTRGEVLEAGSQMCRWPHFNISSLK